MTGCQASHQAGKEIDGGLISLVRYQLEYQDALRGIVVQQPGESRANARCLGQAGPPIHRGFRGERVVEPGFRERLFEEKTGTSFDRDAKVFVAAGNLGDPNPLLDQRSAVEQAQVQEIGNASG